MKIVSVMASKTSGGAETYSVDLMLKLHEAGISLIAVVPEASPRFQELVRAGVRVAPEVFSSRLRWGQKERLRRLVERERPDVLHTWMRRAASLVSEGSAPVRIGWFGGYYDPKYFTACTHLVGVTPQLVQRMITLGVPASKTFYIPTFPTLEKAAPVQRSLLDTPDGAAVYLTLARLHPVKGLDTFLQAVARIPNAYAWIAGDGPLRAELMSLATELNISNRVRFLGWRTDRSALLASADVCVLPSRSEPFGTVILEAWASKTPFVATSADGPKAYVTDGEDGLLVPIDDVAALANAMVRAATDASLRFRMIEGGYASYAKSFTPEVVTASWIQLYKDLLHQRALIDRKALSRAAFDLE